MARHLPTEEFKLNSPKGFWPNPDEEYFYKSQTPPWIVPKRRKCRGRLNHYYDLTEENLKWNQCEEVITHNRFNPLNSTNIELINKEDKKTTEEDKSENLQEGYSEQVTYKNDYFDCINISFSEDDI